MNAIDHIESLQESLPELFQPRDLTPEWDEGYIIMPIEDPCEFPKPTMDSNLDLQPEDEIFLPPSDGEISSALGHDGIVSTFGGSHAGAPVAYNPSSGINPPADALAFYLPFHYYYPKWWGIYIKLEGQLYITSQILKREPHVPLAEAWAAARLYLYFHESFHHKVECFATRLEVTHRKAFYKTGFERYYQDTVLTPACLEESLAEATALDQTKDKISLSPHKGEIHGALVDIVKNSLPGYAEGAGMVGNKFKGKRWQFSENCQGYSLPHLPKKNPEIWATANHMFDPLANIKSRVVYILPWSSPLASRFSMSRPLMSPAKIKRKLKKLVGLKKLTGRKGRHPMYETADGHRLPIPEHPGDLKKGTLAAIIKQAGLEMSVREFQSI